MSQPASLQRRGVLAHGGDDLVAVGVARLDQRHELRARDRREVDAGVERVHERLVAAARHRQLGREQADAAVARRLHRGVRLGHDHADDRHAELLLQIGQRGRGRGVARDHDHLHALALEVAADLVREAPHLAARARPVRQPRVVAEVDEVLVRHRHEALVQHGQAADAGVEDADGRESPWPIQETPVVAVVTAFPILAGAMTAPVRIGTCSWADDALAKHWYPEGTPPRERLAYYAERFSTVEVDSTYYRVPTRQMVQGWADRTPDGFVMHVKAFGLMTRHPVKLEQVPPELREGLPVDDRGRVDRPDRETRGAVFREFLDALTPLRETGKLGGILFQMPPYVVWKPSSLDYLEWARDQVGGDRFLFEPRHRSWYAEEIRAELLRWLEERRMSWVVVDAPKVDAGNVPATLVAATRRSRTCASTAATPAPGTRAAALRRRASTTSTARTSCANGCRRCASCRSQAEETYAFFNNNNQTNGVAQAPAGAQLLRRLLDEEHVPSA